MLQYKQNICMLISTYRFLEEVKRRMVNEISTNEEYNSKKSEVIKLLIERLEDRLYTERKVIIHLTNHDATCSNTITIDDFETDNENICLRSGNYELTINIDKSEIRYVPAEENEYIGDGFCIVAEQLVIELIFLN